MFTADLPSSQDTSALASGLRTFQDMLNHGFATSGLSIWCHDGTAQWCLHGSYREDLQVKNPPAALCGGRSQHCEMQGLMCPVLGYTGELPEPNILGGIRGLLKIIVVDRNQNLSLDFTFECHEEQLFLSSGAGQSLWASGLSIGKGWGQAAEG